MTSNEVEKKEPIPGRNLGARLSDVARSTRWRRRLVWSVAGLLAFWGLAYAIVPGIAKSQIEKIASEKLGRQVTVGAVEFKPWSLELAITDLAIAKITQGQLQGSDTVPQLKIRRIYIDAELESLLRLAPVADSLQIEEPAVSLTHLGEGRYDIDDILAKLKKPDDAPESEAPRFALYNIVVSGGRVDFVDQPLGKTHALRELNLSVPFLSNLQSKRDIKTAPHLAFRLNGSSFDTAAEGTPFAQTRKTDATLKLSAVDLKPYIAYLPASLPFRLQGAVLNADVKVSFEQTPANLVRVSGTITADKVQLLDNRAGNGAGHELLAFEHLRVVMDDVRPLERLVKLSKVELTAPVLGITRDRAGRLNLLPPEATQASSSDPGTTKIIAEDARITRATGINGAKKAPGAAPSLWRVQIANVAVRDGRVNWLDETLASPAMVRLKGLSVNASTIAVPFAAGAPLRFDGSLGLDTGSGQISKAGTAPAAATTKPALTFNGTASDAAAEVSLTVAAWPLNMAAKYVGQFLLPALGGQLDARLGVHWQAAGTGKPQVLQITAPQVSLNEVLLAQGKVSLVSIKRVQVDGADIDVSGQTFKAAAMQLVQPRVLVDRDTDKRWMFERWMVSRKVAGTPVPAPTTATTRAQAPSWAVAINQVSLDGGAMSFSDKAGSKPVAFEVSALNAKLGSLVLDDRTSAKAQAAKLMPLSASLNLSTRRFEPGKLSFSGNLGLTPLQANGQLQVDRLPVQAFEPYFADALNIELLRADASFKGRVAWRQTATGAAAQVTGNAAIEELKANTLAPGEDLLAWKALNLRGLSVALEPGKATRVDVTETVLTDFFARVIVTPAGRINLQDLVKTKGAAGGTTTAVVAVTPDATKIIAQPIAKTEAGALKGIENTVSATSGPPAIINFGPMSLVNGKVLFSDRFVKPNYSADLTDLTGRLSAFSSVSTTGTPDMADLELRGRAEGTASLEILGKLNPLAKPLALDITGKVRDLELPPLSPYAIKYSGYGINRGKLSVDVKYLVRPDGQLTASNKLVLKQLAFGDKVEGSTASLPVKLAVALLADRNGVIDLDLPISGSLNDPQFSLGPVIVKVIINVIIKAITAPFSLLANAFGGSGGGDELGTVSFAPGSARLEPDAKAGLDKVAKALTDRPALQMTVVGTSSLETERDGFKRERLNEQVRSEKRRASVQDGGTATAAISITSGEYPALLREVYKRADLTKPRNLVGLAKDLPEADMEALLLANIRVGDDAMRELALQRGVAVKDYLAGKNLPPERLFLGATKTVQPDPKWTPRAELNLAVP